MAHIKVNEQFPGIISLLKEYPATAHPLSQLAELLLVKDTPTFSKGERETVAAYVSYLNQCVFCSEGHAAVADVHLKNDGFNKKLWENLDSASISAKLRAYLKLAAKVQKDSRSVTQEDIASTRKLGATDADIHDVVLIAAAFCMYNRYVDGLGTFTPPKGSGVYREIGKMLAERGYLT